MHRVNVAVLRGGPSEEFDVSMRTGAAVISALRDSEFQTLDITITKQGEWVRDGYVRDPEFALALADVVLIALHGTYGEDGTIQRILDRMKIPYTGSLAYPSSVAINKYLTKEKLRTTGITMAPHMRVTRGVADIMKVAETIDSLFGPEYVVKPTNSGSSIDTTMVTGVLNLERTIRNLLQSRDEILVEKRIRGREATCGVIERFRGQSTYTLPPIEIIPPHNQDFFTYQAKYSNETIELCPSRFAPSEKAEIERLAEIVHRELDLRQYSRSDFIIASDGIYFLEINTLPGLTETSLLPKALDAVGCSYTEFLHHLLTDALAHRG